MENRDESLILSYIDGNEEAFRELVDLYSSSIFNFSARFVGPQNAYDISQEIFIKVWKNLKKFNNTKASFKTWLFTIARNTIFDFLRKKKVVLFSELDQEENDFVDSIEDENILPDEIVSQMEDQEFLNSLLDSLPENYKTVLVLYYQEEMTFNEISQVLSKPINTIKSHHRRAILKLKELIAPNYNN